jgi:hypothetical protein
MSAFPVVRVARRFNCAFAVLVLVGALASSAAYAIPPGPPNRTATIVDSVKTIPPGPPIRPVTFIDWLKAQLERLVG